MKKTFKFAIMFMLMFPLLFFTQDLVGGHTQQAFASGQCISTHVYHDGTEYSRSYDYSKPYTRAGYYASSKTAGLMDVSDIGNYIHYTDDYPMMTPSTAIDAYGWSKSFWNTYVDSNWKSKTIQDAETYKPKQSGSTWAPYSVYGTKRFKDESGTYYQYRRPVSVERYRDDVDATAPTQHVSPSSHDWTSGNINVDVSFNDGGCWATNVNFDRWRYNIHTGNYYPSSGWSGWDSDPSGKTLTISGEGTYYISLDAVDKSGNESKETYGPYEIDTTVPGASSSLSPSGWTTGNVTINLSTYDSGGSGYDYTRLPNGQTTTDFTPSFTVSSNGTYAFILYDRAGNASTKYVTVDNIDRTDPGATSSLSPSGWTNGNVTINLSTYDSGGSGYDYTRLPNGSTTTDPTPSYTVSSNGIYSFVVYDRASNAYTKTVTVSNVDLTDPTATYSVNPSGWTNGNVTINLAVFDSGSGYYRTKLPDGSYTTDSTPSYSVSSNGVYGFTFYDQAGNSSTKNISIGNIDQVPPRLLLTPSTTNWTKNEVKIIATASDNVGVNRIILPDGSITSGSTATYAIRDNGSYSFTTVDEVGNTTTKVISVSNIDIGQPTVDIQEISHTTTTIGLTLDYGD